MNKFTLWLLSFIINITQASSVYSLDLNTLLPDERNTVELFQRSSSKVVYVHRLATVTNHSFQRIRVSDGAGSGIIWDDKGHVVTNFHVIKGADDLSITLGNMTVPAKVIGKEPRKDIAVLEIKSPPLRAMESRRRGRVVPGSLRACLLYTSPSPRDGLLSRMPSSA